MLRSRQRSGLATVALVVLVVAVVAGALVAFGGPATPDETPIGAEAGDAYEATDGVEATRTTVVDRGGDVHRTVADVALRPGTGYRRVEVLEATDRRYDVVVENGSTVTLYDRDENAATQFSVSGTGAGPTFGDRVERLFDRLSVTDADSTETAADVSPLPVVPAGANSPATGAATDTAALQLSYEGTEAVDGREAYVLRLAAPEDAERDFEQRLWVDRSHFFPLARHTTWTDENGQRVTVETTYEDVDFDPGLDAETFTFDPPANATVETLETPERTAYASVERLAAETNVSVPDPEVPGSLRLTAATETTGEIHGVGLQYVNETASVSVAKYDRTFPPRGDREVEVAGNDAAVSLGTTTSVSWNCGDYRYTVRGGGVSVETLLAVAESVACE
jgi:outer membrane lipoprotein-sorting protein